MNFLERRQREVRGQSVRVLHLSIMQSWFPRPPPSTVALASLAPCARGGFSILPVRRLRRTASEHRIWIGGRTGTLLNWVLDQENQHRAGSSVTYQGDRQAIPGRPARNPVPGTAVEIKSLSRDNVLEPGERFRRMLYPPTRMDSHPLSSNTVPGSKSIPYSRTKNTVPASKFVLRFGTELPGPEPLLTKVLQKRRLLRVRTPGERYRTLRQALPYCQAKHSVPSDKLYRTVQQGIPYSQTRNTVPCDKTWRTLRQSWCAIFLQKVRKASAGGSCILYVFLVKCSYVVWERGSRDWLRAGSKTSGSSSSREGL